MVGSNEALLDEVYQEVILDHFRNPRHQGELENPDASCEVLNPLCGDRVRVSLRLKDGVVEDIKILGKGCSISQAAASMMASLCVGKTLEETQKLAELYHAVMKGEVSVDNAQELGDSLAFEGVRKFPARVKCALIAWDALSRCLKSKQT